MTQPAKASPRASVRPPELAVSDHAALRWIERKHGVDMAALYAEIRAAVVPFYVSTAPRQAIKTGDHCFIIIGGVIVTVKPRDGEPVKLRSNHP